MFIIFGHGFSKFAIYQFIASKKRTDTLTANKEPKIFFNFVLNYIVICKIAPLVNDHQTIFLSYFYYRHYGQI